MRGIVIVLILSLGACATGVTFVDNCHHWKTGRFHGVACGPDGCERTSGVQCLDCGYVISRDVVAEVDT